MISLSELNSIIDQLVKGDSEAFWKIIAAYRLPLRSYIASQVHHSQDIDDLAQEVFVAAFRGIKTFRRDDNFGAWLKGIARNKLCNYLRSEARREKAMGQFSLEVSQLISAELDEATAADTAVTIEMLLHCITLLPEKLRRVVRAGLAGKRAHALAEEFATSVGAIYNQHYRANQLLRQCVEKGLD